MIRLTRINRAPLVLNSDLIEHIATTPDTVITLTNGQVFMVLETTDEVVQRITEFRRQVFTDALRCPFQSGTQLTRIQGVQSNPRPGENTPTEAGHENTALTRSRVISHGH